MKNIIPKFNTRKYNKQNIVVIYNRKQQTYYINNNIYPVDMYTKNNKIVMIFLKSETKDIYKKFKQYIYERKSDE